MDTQYIGMRLPTEGVGAVGGGAEHVDSYARVPKCLRHSPTGGAAGSFVYGHSTKNLEHWILLPSAIE